MALAVEYLLSICEALDAILNTGRWEGIRFRNFIMFTFLGSSAKILSTCGPCLGLEGLKSHAWGWGLAWARALPWSHISADPLPLHRLFHNAVLNTNGLERPPQ
jgi:hypothetical protein